MVSIAFGLRGDFPWRRCVGYVVAQLVGATLACLFLLGVFGDTSLTGKPVGEDLREGKPTMLWAIASERAGPAERRLMERVGAPELDADDVGALQELLVTSGARDEVESLIETLVVEAISALDNIRLTPESCVALRELASYASGRDH